MNALRKPTILFLLSFFLIGCAAQRYKSSPLVPSTTAAQFESRTLADTGVRLFEERNLGHPISPWPPQTWDLQMLSLAGLYFNPALDMARARLATAEAAVVTASARPNPTVDVVPGVPTPYLLTQDVLFQIETAGKRGLRVQAAKKLDQAAQFDLADSAWTVAAGIRTALLNYLVASRNLELLETQEKVRADQVAILGQVLASGEMTRLDVDAARIDLSKTTMATHNAEAQVANAKSALAAAIGVPMAALDGAEFVWPSLDTPPSPDSIPIDQVRREAVVNRLDVRRSLSQYEAAETDLRSEIARQYPNFNIGPGYTYEEQNSFFTVGFSTAVPILNRNEGPIAEAEGRREQAGAVVLQTQAQAIEKSERAWALYAAALKESVEAQSLYRLQEAQLRVIQQSIDAGADYRLTLDSAQIQVSILAQARLDALAHAQQAFGDLEDAVQRPLVSNEILPITVDFPLLKDMPGAKKQ